MPSEQLSWSFPPSKYYFARIKIYNRSDALYLGKHIEIKKAIAEFQETDEGTGEDINENRSKNGKTRKDNRQFIRKPQLKAFSNK
jgi:hypothetical protein